MSTSSRTQPARRRLAVVGSVFAALLVVAVPASAHVGVTPQEVGAGTTHAFEIRVPGERDDARTVEVSVDLPDDLVAVAVDPVDGWTTSATTRTLEEPIELDGCTITEVLDVVTWSGGTIAADGAGSFPLTARAPQEPATLSFPAVQVYDSGEEVAWIGEPGSANPAALVEVVATGDAAGTGDASLACPDTQEAADPAPADDDTAADDADEAGTGAEPVAGDGAGTEGAAGTASDPPEPELFEGDEDASAEDDEGSGVVPVLALAVVAVAITVTTIVVRRR